MNEDVAVLQIIKSYNSNRSRLGHKDHIYSQISVQCVCLFVSSVFQSMYENNN